jgi:hypothetical protein
MTQVKILTRETNLETLNVSYDRVEQYFVSLLTKKEEEEEEEEDLV